MKDFILRNKRTFLMIGLFLLFSSFIIQGFSTAKTSKEVLADEPGLYKFIFNAVDDVFGLGTVKNAYKMLTIDISKNSVSIGEFKLNNIGNFLIAIEELMRTFGCQLVMLYFVIGLMDKLATQEANPYLVIREIFLLLIALLMISISFTFLRDIAAASNELAAQVMDETSTLTSSDGSSIDDVVEKTKMNIYKECEPEDTGKLKGFDKLWIPLKNLFTKTAAQISIVLELSIPWIAMKIINILLSFIIWSRAIELFLRCTLAPIPLADIYNNGPSGSGAKYMKSFAALCLQGVLIIIALALCQNMVLSVVAGQTAKTILNCTDQIVMINCVKVGLCFKTLSLSRELFGLN